MTVDTQEAMRRDFHTNKRLAVLLDDGGGRCVLIFFVHESVVTNIEWACSFQARGYGPLKLDFVIFLSARVRAIFLEGPCFK